MAFPTATVHTGCAETTTNVTTHPVTVPAHGTGDLMIFHFVSDGITESITFPASPVFTFLGADDNSAMGDQVVYRVVDGSEGWSTGGGSTFNVTTASVEQAACAVIVIPAASWHGTTPPEISGGAISNSTAPNPATLTASWGSADNLFIALCGYDDGADTVTAYPTNYADDQTNVRGNDAASAGTGVATRQLASDTDNPTAFTLSAAEQWTAWTIVVRPSTGTTVTPTTTALTLATFAPTVSATANQTVTPTTAALTISLLTPTVTASNHQTVTPTTTALTLTTFAPGIYSGTTVTPTTASLTLTTFAPTVSTTAHQLLTPTTASLALTAFAPNAVITDHKVATPTTTSLALSTFAPTVTATEHQLVTPTTASLILTAFAPVVSRSLVGERAGVTVTMELGTVVTPSRSSNPDLGMTQPSTVVITGDG